MKNRDTRSPKRNGHTRTDSLNLEIYSKHLDTTFSRVEHISFLRRQRLSDLCADFGNGRSQVAIWSRPISGVERQRHYPYIIRLRYISGAIKDESAARARPVSLTDPRTIYPILMRNGAIFRACLYPFY